MRDETQKIIQFYENLTVDSLEQLNDFYSEKCYFKDPFHAFHSREKLFQIYFKMFQKLKNPKFVITNYFEKENQIVLFWDFSFNNGFTITGSSLLLYDQNKLINSHIDYWDSVGELWSKLPIIGLVFKLFNKFLS